MGFLRPIYTVQLCRMRYAYDKSTTRIFSCKSNLQLAYDCGVRHKECSGLLKHVLKLYDNRSDRQFDIVEIVYDFSMTRAARAIKIACDNRKQKSYRVNRPLGFFQLPVTPKTLSCQTSLQVAGILMSTVLLDTLNFWFTDKVHSYKHSNFIGGYLSLYSWLELDR